MCHSIPGHVAAKKDLKLARRRVVRILPTQHRVPRVASDQLFLSNVASRKEPLNVVIAT